MWHRLAALSSLFEYLCEKNAVSHNPVRGVKRPKAESGEGKTLVASAAVTFMTAFPRDRRWLTRDTTLLIHGRRMMRNVHLEGPLGSCRRVLEEIIADIDNGLRAEDEGFAELIVGSAVTLDDIRRRSYGGWYLSASQALELGLDAGLV